jgi:hypothetical protein
VYPQAILTCPQITGSDNTDFCFAGRVNLRAGYNGPLITQITLIVDARHLRVARTCGPAAQDWANAETYHEVEEIKKV